MQQQKNRFRRMNSATKTTTTSLPPLSTKLPNKTPVLSPSASANYYGSAFENHAIMLPPQQPSLFRTKSDPTSSLEKMHSLSLNNPMSPPSSSSFSIGGGNGSSNKSSPKYVDIKKKGGGGLSISPLQPSASMMLISDAASSLEKGSDSLRRMNVESTTKVFEIFTEEGKVNAVFKPKEDDKQDRLGLSNEEYALRERAAYVLDKEYDNFSNVPPTALAKIDQAVGSLQKFIQNVGSVDDNPALLARASVEEAQKIALLDCRIFNLDRHAGNVLISLNGEGGGMEDQDGGNNNDASTFEFGVVSEDGESENGVKVDDDDKVVLIPIDHGLSLPSWQNLSEAFFDWQFWRQASKPLTKKSLEFIEKLDVKKDEACLRALGVKEGAIVTNKICTLLLKIFAKNVTGLTLEDLALILQRPYPSGHKQHDTNLSILERMIEEVCNGLNIKFPNAVENQNMKPSDRFFNEFINVAEKYSSTGEWRDYVVN